MSSDRTAFHGWQSQPNFVLIDLHTDHVQANGFVENDPGSTMARSNDVILVVDVESTCWEHSPPEGQTSEIIEVGLCPVDVATLTRREKCSILVKPAMSEISTFCTGLTTLQTDMFTEAGSLQDAVSTLRRKYRSRDRLWASWGDYDRRQFERVCQLQEVSYPFGPSHLNVKSLFAVANGQYESGLDDAFQQLDWTMEGTHHRGHDDAWNIAGILCELLRRMRT